MGCKMANFTVAYLFQLRDDFSAKARKLARESQNARKSVHGLGSVFNSMTRDANAAGAAVGRVAHRMRALRTVGRGMGSFGFMGALGGMAGGGFGVGSMVTKMMGFQDAINSVEAKFSKGKGMDPDRLAEMRRGVQMLGKTTRYTTTQVANALNMLAMAGQTYEQAIGSDKKNFRKGALATTLSLGAATGADLSRSADIVTNIMSAYGVPVANLSSISDSLTFAVNSSNQNIYELAEAMKMAGPASRAFGVSMEQTAAATMVLANAGIKASLAGTGFRRMVTRLVSVNSESAKVFQKLGIDPKGFVDKNGKIKDIWGAVDAFKQAGAKPSDVMKIFGDRAGPIMLRLMTQSSAALRELEAAIKNAKGAAENSAAIMEKGLGGAIRRLYSHIEAATLIIGDSGMAKDVDRLAQYAIGLADAFISLDDGVKKLIGRGLLAFAGFSALVVPLGILAMTGGALVPVFGALAGGLSVMARFAALPFFAGLGAAVGYMTRLTAAFLQFGPVATGVLAVTARVITGFTAIGAAIYYWKELSQVVMGFFSGLSSAYAGSELQTAVSWLTSAMSGIATAVGQITGISFEGSGLQSFFDAGKAAAEALLNPITSIQKALGWIGGKLGIVGQAQAVAGKMSINPNTARKWVSSTHAAAQRHQSGPHPYMNNTPIAPVARQSVDVKVTAPPAIEIKYNGPITGPGQINVGTRNRGDTSTSSAETETP